MKTFIETQGSPPNLAGVACEELFCQQYWYDGKLAEEANVIYLRCGSVWHSLCIDCGVIFWRTGQTAPLPHEIPDLAASYRVVDLSVELDLRAQTIKGYETSAVNGEVRVEFIFESGRRLSVCNKNDCTSLVV